jgi:hypothetical protein
MTNFGRSAAVAGTPGGQVLPWPINPFWSNLDPKIWDLPKDYFSYGVTFDSIAAGATTTEEFQVQSDSHFMILAATLTAVDPATPGTVFDPADLLCRITDAGSGREVMNQQVHVRNLFGDGELPAYWPYPKIIKRSSTVVVELENLEAAQALRVFVDFLGFKLFRGPGFRVVLDD